MPEAFWGEFSPWGLVGVFVLLVATGGLIPRWMHNQRVADYKRENALLRETLAKREAQVETLIQQNSLAVNALDDLKTQASGRGGGRHHQVTR